MKINHLFAGILGVSTLMLTGCAGTYFQTMESLGTPKREILVSRVVKAQEDQEEAKTQFQTTLEQFAAATGFDGGDLEAMYKRLNSEYEACEKKADRVRERIKSIESVADALFDEWEKEIQTFQSANLKEASSRQLQETQGRYVSMLGAMRSAEARMQPVLDAFRDQVLFLKHNLNAAAIASLEDEVSAIESDVSRLIGEMEKSISEAETFIASMRKK